MLNYPDREKRVRAVADLGATIRAARKRAGLEQKDAAGLAGVGLRFLSDLERGKPTVRMDKVLQVLDVLGLELTVQPRRARYG
ncbi:MAG: helix-turn-helix transcriptional regulator [Halofilum sp. (in: g-proteobacteria)]|nr:helix-turn-helix transcriptional regulator [Halofilum sp. (in: g-proteobacteria)]